MKKFLKGILQTVFMKIEPSAVHYPAEHYDRRFTDFTPFRHKLQCTQLGVVHAGGYGRQLLFKTRENMFCPTF